MDDGRFERMDGSQRPEAAVVIRQSSFVIRQFVNRRMRTFRISPNPVSVAISEEPP
jgi:hypothetical protein